MKVAIAAAACCDFNQLIDDLTVPQQIIDDAADLYLGKVLEVSARARESHSEFLRSMLMSIVVGYEMYFRRSDS